MPLSAPFAHIRTWIFDLDNTLYPKRSDRLFPQVEKRIGEYVARHLGLGPEEAYRVQKSLFRAHGTTMRGLMVEHGVDPHHFLAHAHDIDYGLLDPNPGLDGLLAALPGDKLVYTNGSTDHARKVLAQLGVARHFKGIFDIVDGDFRPKPDPVPFAAMVARHGVDPRAAVFVEDLARNLEPAAALGMTTVWLRHDGPDWQRPQPGDAFVHHVIDDLDQWLAGLTCGDPAVD